jgi:hypothetical protein
MKVYPTKQRMKNVFYDKKKKSDELLFTSAPFISKESESFIPINLNLGPKIIKNAHG